MVMIGSCTTAVTKPSVWGLASNADWESLSKKIGAKSQLRKITLCMITNFRNAGLGYAEGGSRRALASGLKIFDSTRTRIAR